MVLALRVYQTIAKAGMYEWYVDSVNGNDSNSGRSPAAAFRTLSALNAAGIAAHDRIGLARGSYWREMLDLSGFADKNGVRITTYGAGERPVIDCRDIISNDAFTKTAGRTNVYQRSVDFTPSVTDANLAAWEDGVILQLVASLADCDATPGSYYIASHTVSPQNLYVHSTDSSSVITNDKIYTYNPRIASIYAQYQSRISIDGVETVGNLSGAGSIACGAFATVKNCVIRDGNKHSLYVGTGALVDSCTFTDLFSQVSFSGTMLVVNADTPNNEGATIKNCHFSMSSRTGPNFNGALPINGHNNTSGSFGAINIENCSFDNFHSALIAMEHTTTVNVTGCTFTNCKYGMSPTANCDQLNYTDTVWTSNITGQRIVSAGNTGNLSITNMTATMTVETDIGYLYVSAGAHLSVTDSSFNINSVTGYPRNLFYVTSAAAVITATGNTYNGPWSGTDYVYFTDPGAGAYSLTSDHNTFQAFRVYYDDVVYADLAAWRSATGQDQNSVMS